ncbi:MAG: DNA mismatch repair protein MutS [Candidatus Izemoplasmatales bacterium]|nr:DNA mismatch repair protein MutS [Candidatus Izemoplasmatales bacterium]
MKNIDSSIYTPMMQQYLDIKKDYMDFIVFFRLGDFYEMFFTDALVASKELEIVLTGRDAGVDEKVPMCGVPYHAANIYIEKLIDKGFKVAIVEQVEDPKLAKSIVKREVIKIITPGTLMEDGTIDEKSNNFIVSITESKEHYLLAYSDLSTGQNYIISLPKEEELLFSEILNLNAREIVIGSDFHQLKIKPYLDMYELTISIHDDTNLPNFYRNLILDIYDKEYIKAFGRLISYLLTTQKRELLHLQKVQVFESTSYLRIDNNSKRNLELTETLRQSNRKGTLFWLLDVCETAMGSRFLKQNILRPLVDKTHILKRFSFVESLNDHFILQEELRTLLKVVYDLERIIGRISFGNANAKDMMNLARSLQVIPDIKSILISLDNEYALDFLSKIDDFTNLKTTILSAIVDNPPLSITDGGFIKAGYSTLLDNIKDQSSSGKTWLEAFEASERERTGIRKLKIGYNRVFGYYIEVSKGQTDLVKDEFGYERKQTLSNSERYVTPELKIKESQIIGSLEESVQMEYQLFLEIRDIANKEITPLQTLAKAISEIDMLYAFSKISMQRRYMKPEIIENRQITIVNGRHPVVEVLLENEPYVENNINMDEQTNILLITGPNMSGKSTYMRQLALTVILMQIGCFVPCEYASLPIFDQIFTRIGASDDLTGGKSTFMVEMIEVHYALQNATEKSLILFDEIGRGTATYDGMALAQAIIEYAHQAIKCKILFSTHYHELTYLEDDLKSLHNVHVLAKEEKGSIVFMHKVIDGPTDKSYGIHVAELAHLPKALIRRAKSILLELEKNHGYNIIKPQTIDLFNYENATEKELEIESCYQSVIDQLDAINIQDITPLQAINLLADVLEEVKKIKLK